MTTFVEITIDTTEKAIIRSNNWESDSPGVQLFFGSSIYAGNVNREAWDSLAECFERDPAQFFEENKKAITCATEVGKYKYTTRNRSEEALTFIWSKELGEGTVIKCGEIDLRLSSESILDFTRNCVQIVTSLTEELEKQKEKASKAETETSRLVDEYTKILEGRVNAEEENFGKFLRLLNEKKRKIRDLQVEQY